MNLSSLTNLTIPEGVVSQITGADGKVLWSSVSYDPVFANNTWEQIVKACHRNQVPDTWSVGDQKSMIIDGTDYPIDIIGKNHDDYSDGSGKAPLTFQMHNVYGTTAYPLHSTSTNACSWDGCTLRTQTIPSVLQLMPSEVREGIRLVSKPSSAGSKSSDIINSNDTLFILSEVELAGTTEYSADSEGTQYLYYAEGNTFKKTIIGSTIAQIQWLRSPKLSSNNYWVYVTSSGSISGSIPATSANVFAAFAFCF